jgi:hypothetical protein
VFKLGKTFVSAVLFRDVFVNVAKEVIQGAVNFDIDINGDVNGLDFDGLDFALGLDFVLGFDAAAEGESSGKQGKRYDL